jgi:N-acetylglucosaminyldiphosphoundecaprenol N-acetyl-beta-D-mannosaminyltransferase
MSRRPSPFLGVSIGQGGTLDQIMDRSLAAIRGDQPPMVFACANPHSLVAAQQDPEFLSALNAAQIVVADGVGVSLAARMLGIEVGPRITGDDFFRALLAALARNGRGRVFFFGSSDRVLGLIAERFARDYPQLTLCGSLSPPFREFTAAENADMVAAINAARPDVLWVGMTAPKQEKWVQSNHAALHAPVIGSIGAVFEFFAGTNPRAPAWMCAIGLEWLYRLLREPGRMWQRVAVSGPRFAAAVVRQHVFSAR